MPIELFTGLPGNGKTAFLMERLLAEAKKGERAIVAVGIDGLAPGLALHLDDAKSWNAHDPNGEPTCNCHVDGRLHAHVVPDGSLIFVDEAWKSFGHLHDASRQPTPLHVLALAEHRHRGLDFVWTTQQPNQLYPFTRGLIARHTHVVRRFGTQFVELFSWEELNEDVKSVTKRENAMRSTRMLPKEVFDQYKSATLHTIKRRLPLKLFVLPIAAILAVLAAWFAYQSLKPEALRDKLQGVAGTDAVGVGPQDSAIRPSAEPPTLDQYLSQLSPRIATMPWSAPAFDGREVTADPMLYCMSSGQDGETSCSCVTEQGTPYVIDPKICRLTARNGAPYNAYRQQEREEGGHGREQRYSDDAGGSARSAASSELQADQISSYGDLGIVNKPGTVP